MKILVFEYVCGGGLCAEDLPTGLAKEGLLMLSAMIKDLSALPEHSFSVLIDCRFTHHFKADFEMISIQKESDILTIFKQALVKVDSVWLVAPESEGILFKFTRLVELADKQLLSPPSDSLVKMTDKWQTFQALSSHHIPTVTTAILTKNMPPFTGKVIIKKRDGVGCEDCFIMDSPLDLSQQLEYLTPPEKYIIQPFIHGENLSLSAIFKHGNAELLCVNRQHIQIKNKHIKLQACEVNYAIEPTEFKLLLNKIALAFPRLWGYVGIDLISHQQQWLVLEINPRLTSSYAGISQALHINVAAAILKLSYSELEPFPISKHSIRINLH
ncbi:MAG: ATP-grasp domain-containing protein [Methylococcales bacterium]|nr:ATP-grasp domain-containing protein [Methylococcales bacterium]